MERRGHRRAGVLIALAAWLGAGAAVAQPTADRARDFFREGVDHMNAERWQQAAEAFRASYDAAPRVATMCNLALAYDRWAAYPEIAVEAYDRCAREDTSGRYREHATTRAAELRTEIAARTEPAPAPPPEQELPPDTGRIDAPPPEPEPVQPIVPPAGPPPSTPTERGHPLLFAGIGVGVLSIGALAGGIALASSANGDADELWRRHPDGQIPAGSPDADLLDDAESKSTWSIALYIVAAATGALATTLVVLDLTTPSVEPLEGGALLTLRTPL